MSYGQSGRSLQRDENENENDFGFRFRNFSVLAVDQIEKIGFQNGSPFRFNQNEVRFGRNENDPHSDQLVGLCTASTNDLRS
jgi:hypothetical protein